MNWKIYILFWGILVSVSSCVLDEAKPDKHEKIIFYTDNYCPADSVIIREFEQSKHISVQVVYKPKDEIARLIQKNKFNTGIDVLLLSSDSLRENLYNQSLFSQLKGRTYFRNIDRQFNNNHSYWVPICHNPLIMVTSKDSASNCPKFNWSKFRSDSISPKIGVKTNLDSYLVKLGKTEKFARIGKSKTPVNPKFTVYTLDQIVELTNRDVHFSRKNCCYYLVENQRFMTNFTSISLYKYSRNKVASQKFIEFYSRFQYQMASNRNQLSTFKTIQPNFLIRALEIQ